MQKTCFKCLVEKPIDAFYKHGQMADGRLGKCKECTKADAAKRYSDPSARERIREYERARFKTPERKRKVKLYVKARVARDPTKDRARQKLSNAIRSGAVERKPCQVCGSEKSQAHHGDYQKPLEVTWLCFKHHREAHGQTVKV